MSGDRWPGCAGRNEGIGKVKKEEKEEERDDGTAWDGRLKGRGRGKGMGRSNNFQLLGKGGVGKVKEEMEKMRCWDGRLKKREAEGGNMETEREGREKWGKI